MQTPSESSGSTEARETLRGHRKWANQVLGKIQHNICLKTQNMTCKKPFHIEKEEWVGGYMRLKEETSYSSWV